MNQTVQEIFEDYRYQFLKATMLLSEGPGPGRIFSLQTFESLMRTIDKLETLIDLYAYLLACRKDREERFRQ